MPSDTPTRLLPSLAATELSHSGPPAPSSPGPLPPSERGRYLLSPGFPLPLPPPVSVLPDRWEWENGLPFSSGWEEQRRSPACLPLWWLREKCERERWPP